MTPETPGASPPASADHVGVFAKALLTAETADQATSQRALEFLRGYVLRIGGPRVQFQDAQDIVATSIAQYWKSGKSRMKSSEVGSQPRHTSPICSGPSNAP